MTDRSRVSFSLDVERVDHALLKQLRAKGAPQDSLDRARWAFAPGFNLATLMTDEFGPDFEPSHQALGPLSVALEQFGYWLFAYWGAPLVARPSVFNEKAVRIIATRRDLTSDQRRAVIAVFGGADAIYVPIPAVPEGLLPTTGPWNIERARDALLAFANACVDRVNIIAPAAVHLGALVKGGYPTGSVDTI